MSYSHGPVTQVLAKNCKLRRTLEKHIDFLNEKHRIDPGTYLDENGRVPDSSRGILFVNSEFDGPGYYVELSYQYRDWFDWYAR